MLAQHAVNVYVISASIWEVMIPVLGLAIGAIIGACISMWLMAQSHKADDGHLHKKH